MYTADRLIGLRGLRIRNQYSTTKGSNNKVNNLEIIENFERKKKYSPQKSKP